MIIATWNVNSIRARLEHAVKWARQFRPDVLLLQEIKCTNNDFPLEPFEDLGYNIALNGQKSYNGVAILSKAPLEDVVTTLPQTNAEQARYIEAVTGNVRVASIYVPNGSEVGSEKFQYKLHFLDCLAAHTRTLLSYDEAFVLGGDYNITPADIDVYDPIRLAGKLHCTDAERMHLRKVLNTGVVDINRALSPQQEMYTWWDYRAGSWPRNEGLRIDLLLGSPQAMDRVVKAGIDVEPRGWERPSDHVPTWVELYSS